MIRPVTWRCEACGAKLTADTLIGIGRLDRTHAATCPDQDAQKLLAESRRRHPSFIVDPATGDVIESTGGEL